MVMETPSPQCVGREFVRQYYTLLHESPRYLHRFYSHNSSFVHGGVEKPGEEQPPVMGQSDIHKKIMSLNFNDCHAKIRQVDSQATVGNAVVVQVTGELSNNGQPMRRFMQTFVLAPQSAKKYYVHNDIFRYQDEVFHDNDTDTEMGQEETVVLADSEPETPEPMAQQPATVQDPAVTSYYEPPQPALSNGNAHMEEVPDSPPQKITEEPEKQVEEEVEPVQPPQEIYEEPIKAKTPEPEPEPEVPEPITFNNTTGPAEPPKPFTWAAMAGKNTQSSVVGGGSAPAPGIQQPMVSKVQPAPKPEMAKPPAPAQGDPSRSGPVPLGQRPARPPRERGARERDGSRDNVSKLGGDDFRRSRYPDANQVFVGNLPHNVPESELKEFFEKYGKVVELRINKKSSGNVPNFGFVVFEEASTVQKVLDSKPFMLRGEHRLNVEEKKQRGESGRPGSGNRLGGRGGSSGPMRGGGGMGGMGRGGSRGGGTGMGGGGMRTDARVSSGGPGSDRGGRGGGFGGGLRR